MLKLALPTLSGADPGAGASSDVSTLGEKTVQVVGTFVATLQLEGSDDNTNWGSLGLPITAPGFYVIPALCEHMRVNVTAYTSQTGLAVYVKAPNLWGG
jgi:hypothetical protein